MRSKKAVFLLIFIMIMALLSSGCIFSVGLVIEAISDQIGKVGQEFIYQVIAYDPNNGELTYSLTEKPEGMQIGSSTGLINWTPGESQIGTFTVEVIVSNGNSFSVKQFKITIEDIYLISIEVSPANINVGVGNSNIITSITAYYDNGGSIDLSLTDCNYDSDNPNIATVNNGVITGISAGNTTITVSYTEGGITKTDTVSVTVEDISLTSIEVSPASINIYIGNSSTINSITAFYSDGSSLSIGLGSATYSSNNPGIASVNTTGRITGVSAGSATITVSYTEGGITKTDTVGVTVLGTPKILTSIEVSPAAMQIHTGNSKTITSITANYYSGDSADLALTDCNYDSDNPTIATVNNGVITGVSAGSATITVSYTEDSITKTDTVSVIIVDEALLTSIVVLPTSVEIAAGSSETITSVTAHYDNGISAGIALSTCTYGSNNTSVTVANGVITVSSSCTATTAIITVSYTEGGVTKSDTVTVTVPASGG